MSHHRDRIRAFSSFFANSVGVSMTIHDSACALLAGDLQCWGSLGVSCTRTVRLPLGKQAIDPTLVPGFTFKLLGNSLAKRTSVDLHGCHHACSFHISMKSLATLPVDRRKAQDRPRRHLKSERRKMKILKRFMVHGESTLTISRIAYV